MKQEQTVVENHGVLEDRQHGVEVPPTEDRLESEPLEEPSLFHASVLLYEDLVSAAPYFSIPLEERN